MSNKSAMYLGGCVIGVAILFLLFGLLLLLGGHKASTLLVGVLLVAFAIAAGAFAIRKMGQLASASPDAIDDRILNLATMSGGEVTVAEAAGALQIPVADAQASLERLVSKGMAEHKVRDQNLYYAFAGITSVRKVKRCAYCGTEFPIREPGMKCPSCGGSLEIVEAKE